MASRSLPGTATTAPPGQGELRFTVLGPVRAHRGDEQLTIGASQQRVVLSALLLRAGETVTPGTLMNAVWGQHPPQRAVQGLRTYVLRLCQVVGPGVLVPESGGYALRLPPGRVDLQVCERLAADAARARAAGEPALARRLLTSALDLWDGEALLGVPGRYAQAQRARLSEWRLTLLEQRLELDLALGGHREAVAEITALTARFPLRQRLRGLLMLALYRGGRRTDALAVFAVTERLLREELGVPPSPELTHLHQRILAADPAPPRRPRHAGPDGGPAGRRPGAAAHSWGRSRSRSTTTGAWSEAPLPLRSSRST
ncbi:AfsR/SARP family transcriptional regulator [Wenjunlia vitaminophila]|uniref:AfsR/SARP family transcriptional regulator n=1 Tax=Wenjunlia vitaminophila TaxID=76728 RepID=UPI002AFF49E2|nr:BTAD domain-containing putative transcriptional regulator [Wenjunlia vitaminophila]